jgi:hypothetical protein
MNKGKRLTFYGLFDLVESIEIPILQRDYAQGRKEEGEVRTLFLNSLFDALNKDNSDSRQPLDLDFVYGNFEEGQYKVFSVLDGQQRLTTLYLLHWFLAIQHGHLPEFRNRFVTKVQPSSSKFTYKTRPSTTEFFDALTSKDLPLSTASISGQIKNSQWFYLSWLQDQTVQACLNMLDAIQILFANNAHYFYERLVNTNEPYITFQFLDLHSFGLSDELYIKMNARGKPLTIFENFKAKLEQKIKSFEEPWPEYQLSFKAENVDGYEYFIHKIDTDWADLFWPYRNVCSEDNTFDDELMNFIRLIIAYQYLVDNKGIGFNLIKARNGLFGFQSTLRAATLSKYEELGCINQQLINQVINTLDHIQNNGLVDNKIKSYLTDAYYYSEENTFKRVLENTASYDDKLRFYAFYNYLSKSPASEELDEWVRVIYNLTENTIINTFDEFYRALFAIDELFQSDSPILVTLASGIDISGFAGAQTIEEKIKAHLLLKSNDWRVTIIQSEKHSFLNGQIGCILNFAGILAYYREHKDCDWNQEQDKRFLASFNEYSKAIRTVFDRLESSSSSMDFLWERAVLSKGVYFTHKKGSDKYNMLSSRDTRHNKPRDHSWRRLLRFGTAEIEQKQSYIKAVLDDPLFDVSNFKGSLESICSSAMENEGIETWRKPLIKHKELMEYCQQGFIEKNGFEFILLNESQRNHYHSELYTKALELELTEEISLLKPFSRISYEAVKSREDSAFVQINGMALSDQRYSLEIRKVYSAFNLRFKGGDIENYTSELKMVLESEWFELKDSFIPNFGYYQCKVESKQGSLGEIKTKLINLCGCLKELTA